MRKKRQQQMPLIPPKIDHPQANELEAISRIIDSKPIISEHVMQDLCKGRPATLKSGANGMTAEQVLRAAIVKMLFGFTYKELAFHMVDSQSIRRFCQIGIADKGLKSQYSTIISKLFLKEPGKRSIKTCSAMPRIRKLKRAVRCVSIVPL